MEKVLAKLFLSVVLGSLLFALADAFVATPWRLRGAAERASRGVWTAAEAKAEFGTNCAWWVKDQRIPAVEDYPALVADDVATTQAATRPLAK